MKIRILGSAVGVVPAPQYVSSYIVNESVAIDAGALGLNGAPGEQAKVRHVFLTHIHMDHIATLPVFLEHAFDPSREGVTVYGHPETLADLRKYVFNDVIWPDFVRLSTPSIPLLKLCAIDPETPVQLNGLAITPVVVDHIVATYAYIVTDGASTVVFGGDSGPTDRLWKAVATTPAPRSVFLEASFPNAMHQLANDARHLTPKLVAAEILKMPEHCTIFAIHIKPRFQEDTIHELLQLKLPNLVIGNPGGEYEL